MTDKQKTQLISRIEEIKREEHARNVKTSIKLFYSLIISRCYNRTNKNN